MPDDNLTICMCVWVLSYTCLRTEICAVVKMGSITSVAGYPSLNSYLINYLFLEQYIYILLGGYWGMNKRVSRPFHNPL